ncbi:MAG: MFS transporter [Haloglomus sp.]
MNRDILSPVRSLRGDGRGWVLLTMAAGWLLIIGIRLVVPALLPLIKAEFALDNVTAGAVVSLLWVTYAVMQFPSGVLTDRVGERAVLAASVALVLVSVAGLAVSAFLWLFVIAAALLGVGTGLFGTPRVTVLSNTFPESEGLALGVTFAAGSVGAAGLPVVAGALSALFGWRASFAVSLPVLLVLLYGVWRFTPRTTSTDGGGRLSRAELGHLASSVWNRPVLVAAGATALMLFSYQGIVAFFATYLVETKGFTPGTAASFYTLFFAAGAITQPTSGALADTVGERYVLAGLAGVAAVPLFALPFARGTLWLAALALLLGIRRGTGPVGIGYIVTALPDDVEASGLGLLRTGMFALSSVGSLLVGWMADGGMFDEAFQLLGVVTVAAAVLYLFLPGRDGG